MLCRVVRERIYKSISVVVDRLSVKRPIKKGENWPKWAKSRIGCARCLRLALGRRLVWGTNITANWLCIRLSVGLRAMGEATFESVYINMHRNLSHYEF
jgi:hypothetical protein